LPFYNGKIGAKIVSIKTQGERGIVFKLDQPSSVFLEKLAYIQCPVTVLHPDSWDSAGNWVKPIATGPYKFSEWKKGRYILLKKFGDYVPRQDQASGLAGKKIAHADQIRFMIISDLMATKAALASGQVDLAGSLAPITALDIKHNKRVKAMELAGLTRRAVLIQTDDTLLNDIRIRQAIAYAFDMKTFTKIASLGIATANPSVIPSNTQHHTDLHSKGYPFDLAKSRELLKQANYQGEEIVIKTTRVEQAYFDSAMISEAMLKKAGLNIKIEVMEMAALLGDYFDGNYQLMAFEYTPRMTAFMNYHTLIGDKKTNPNRWGNKQARALLRQVASHSDPEQQQRLYDQIHQLMLREAPVINLYNAPIIDVVSTRLQGYQPWLGSKPRLWNVRINKQ
jgi:peptide/nickel transport system substrate-binding protein